RTIDTIGGVERCQTCESQGYFARQDRAVTTEDRMKRTRGILTGLLLGAATIVAVALAGQAPNEEASVRATVETYLHGLKFNDVESFKRAFYRSEEHTSELQS